MASSSVNLNSLLVVRDRYRQGRSCLRGTGITVHSVAAAHQLGLSAEEICAQNSDLDASLFYAALAYYFANRAQIDSELAADSDSGSKLAATYPQGITSETFRR
jgi:uncharacterized protein (DUF433 family)